MGMKGNKKKTSKIARSYTQQSIQHNLRPVTLSFQNQCSISEHNFARIRIPETQLKNQSSTTIQRPQDHIVEHRKESHQYLNKESIGHGL